MEYGGIILFIIGFLLGGAIIWFIRQKELDAINKSQGQLKDVFGDLSNEALIQSQKKFLELAEDKFSSILGKSDDQLSKKKELIDTTLKDMKNDLKNLSENTVALKSQMEESRKNMGELSDTTSQLRQILSSSQARGRWGERMVEDILKFIGLTEGINYEQQTQAGSDRPDFTFFLPDDKSLNMDVKFPLDHYEKFLGAENESEKDAEKKYFIKDVRNRINDVSKRSYIDPEGGTVDYVLLFIPNESIYSFIHLSDNTIMDRALSKKVVFCSPLTLFAILCVVRQAVHNFSLRRDEDNIISLMGRFNTEWSKFTESLEKFGKRINVVQGAYDELNGTRRRQMQRSLDRIRDLQLNRGLPDASQEALTSPEQQNDPVNDSVQQP